MRVVAWNIRAGGGERGAIARQIARWAPDVVALSEFRATPPSCALAAAIAATASRHQLTTADAARPRSERPAHRRALAAAARASARGAASSPPLARGRRGRAASPRHRRHARPESRRRTQVSVPRRGAGVRARLARTGPRCLSATPTPGGAGIDEEVSRVQRARGGMDRRAGRLRLARRLPPSAAPRRAPTPGTRRTAATAFASTRRSSTRRCSPT